MIEQTLSGAEALVTCPEAEGVAYVVGLSGGAVIPIFDAFLRMLPRYRIIEPVRTGTVRPAARSRRR